MEKYVSLDGLKTIAKTINEISVSMEEFKAALEEIAKIGCRMDAMEEALAYIGSATNAKTENPNLKSDLEISNRIIPSREFLQIDL